jgi:hypothetical protein
MSDAEIFFRILQAGAIQSFPADPAVVQAASLLSYCPERYFSEHADAIAIPVKSLILTRARKDGIANACRLMSEAFQGLIPKRAPIKVKQQFGGYTVQDGNSTAYVAMAAAWPDVPCVDIGTPSSSGAIDA